MAFTRHHVALFLVCYIHGYKMVSWTIPVIPHTKPFVEMYSTFLCTSQLLEFRLPSYRTYIQMCVLSDHNF